MKIAFIGIKSYPAAHGGMETMTQSIVDSLLKDEVNKYIIYIYPLFSSSYSSSNQKNLYIRPVKVKNILYVRSILGVLGALPRLMKDKPNVVHINGIENAYIIPFLRVLGYNVILNIRGIRWTLSKWENTYFHFSNIPIILAKLFFKINIVLFSWSANKIVTVNEHSIKSLPAIAQKKTDVIYNSLELNYTNDTKLLEKLMIKKNEYILFIGRIVPLKGLHHLVNAFNSIGNIKEPLIVVGSFTPDNNNYHKYLSNLANLQCIKFVGPYYGDGKFTLMSNAKLIILPSETEGMAVTILEAALLKIPILVSDIPENKTLWENAVHYFKNSDENNLKVKLELLLNNNTLRSSKISDAFDLASKKFNHPKQIKLFKNLYNSLVNN